MGWGELLAVAAHAEDGRLADFSNRGAWVHVAAPGDRILSSVPAGEYGVWSGTSMAAPLVAGQAALLRATQPAWTPAQVTQQITATASAAPAVPPLVDVAAALGLRATERPSGGGEVFLPKVMK